MPPPKPRRRRLRHLFLLTTALAGLLTAGLASPAAAYSDPYPERNTIQTAAGYLDVSTSGDFARLVYPAKGPISHATSNLWTKSSEYYVSGGRTYHTYRSIRNGQCLSHDGDLLLTDSCDYGEYRQWWAIDTIYLPCAPAPCWQTQKQLFSPWDQATQMLTAANDWAYLSAKQGTLGSAAQHVAVSHIPAPPW